ncbi:MAG: hypothetical protein J5527_09395 [Treponema sp.]|nr:hypothetical protein [Treponema sp.]
METKYFKTTDREYLKLDYDYCNDPYDPRDPDYQTNLGTMVFPEERNPYHAFGDLQPESFEEFFKNELSEAEPHEYMEGSIEFTFPSLEDCQNNEALSRFIAGTEENGFHFDVDLFNQEMDSILSSVKDNLGSSVCEDLTGGIPVDEKTGRLTDSYIINLRTSNCKDYYGAESAYNRIRDELSDCLNVFVPKNFFNYQDSIHHFNELEGFSESQLYDKWAETKFCVIPINIYEHSGITCHEASLRKTLHAANDRDDGAIYNDGFIYVNKNNQEVLNELKGEARDEDGNLYNKWKPKTPEETKAWAEKILKQEIKEYARFLEGNVFDVSIYELDKSTLDWGEPVVGYNSLFVDDVEEYIKENNEYAGKIVSEIYPNIMDVILNTPTPEFKKNAFENYVSKIKEILPDYDNNIKYAASAATLAMKSGSSTNLEIKALNLYLKENGCTNPENTFKMLEKAVGIKTLEKVFDPFEPGYEVFFHTNPNPNSSNYHSKASPFHALVVDKENKRYGLLSGSYSFSGNQFNFYQKIPVLSIKKLREKIEELESYGLKFQKFTTSAGEYSQGNPKELYPRNRQKEIESRYER